MGAHGNNYIQFFLSGVRSGGSAGQGNVSGFLLWEGGDDKLGLVTCVSTRLDSLSGASLRPRAQLLPHHQRLSVFSSRWLHRPPAAHPVLSTLQRQSLAFIPVHLLISSLPKRPSVYHTRPSSAGSLG
jgi:hypothetical protein